MRRLATLLVLAAALALPAVAAARPLVASPGVGIDYAKLPGLQTGGVPWGPDDGQSLRARLDRLGLPVLSAEQLQYHIHAHLDLFVHGVQIPIPPNVGIDYQDGYLTVLHTHNASGIIHVESATKHRYQLGDFFGVWGVRLSSTCIGMYCARKDAKVRTWVDGRPYAGNPAGIVIKEHERIVLTVGVRSDLPRPLPKFAWPAGY
jgi:hypothetical protein